MAKLRETINGATIDVEGDEEAVAWASRQFHCVLAEQALREVDAQLVALRPLQRQKHKLQTFIAELKKSLNKPPSVAAVHEETDQPVVSTRV